MPTFSHLAVVRVGRRPSGAAAAAGLLPLALYAGWYATEYRQFKLVGGDGVALWARTMTFADCKVIKPPPSEAPLCPNGSWQDAASEYVWAQDSPINRMPGGRADNDLARSFALRAIRAQPLDHVVAVGCVAAGLSVHTSTFRVWARSRTSKVTRPARRPEASRSSATSATT